MLQNICISAFIYIHTLLIIPKFITNAMSLYGYNGDKNMEEIHDDVIFAPITPVGGAVCVVRVSGGANALKVFQLFQVEPDKFKHRLATVTNVINPSDERCIVDHAIVTVFFAPNSFTGENVIEIAMHGGNYVVRQLCDMLAKHCNFRFAKGGEFAKRAFLNGKIDLVTAEGINAIIRAETASQHALATKMYNGSAGEVYKKWRSDIISAIALLEVGVDFSDEDIPENVIKEFEKKISTMIDEMSRQIDMFAVCEKINNGVDIAIIGLPNAGKSSLINALSRKDVAIVTDIAGTTRDAIECKVDLAGVAVNFIDTAGIRESSDLIEMMGVEASIRKMGESSFNIITIDGSAIVSEFGTVNNAAIAACFEGIELKVGDIIAVNKIDEINNAISNSVNNVANNTANNVANNVAKNSVNNANASDASSKGKPHDEGRMEESIKNSIIEELLKFANGKSGKSTSNTKIEEGDIIFISAKSGVGISQILDAISLKVNASGISASSVKGNASDYAISIDRHREYIAEVVNILRQANISDPHELLLDNLNYAASLIGGITGEIGVDDILDNIFNKFCIGK